MSDRSGKISGSVLTQVGYDKVSGNKSKSFLDNGSDYLSEVSLDIQEKLGGDYNFEGRLRLRKTDNPRIEPRRDVRTKEYQLKIANPDNLFLFGDFYGELSPFTLGTSLEGATAELKVNDNFFMKHIAARSSEPDVAASKFQRNVFGSKADVYLFRDSDAISNARFGIQAVTVRDDSSTPDRTSSFQDLRNNVFSVDGEMSFVKYLSFNYELARSMYIEDEDSGNAGDQKYGNAARIVLQLQTGDSMLRHLYAYVQPGFYTDTGSAASDKIQHQTTLDHRFSRRVSVSLMHNYYWDHLSGSLRDKRTISDDKSVSLNLTPFAVRETFRTRIYSSYNLRNSDDPANTLESRTATVGFGVNDRWRNADVGFSYEYREFKNYHDKSRSDYFNRLGLSLAREYTIWARRLYLSLNPNADFRRTKTDDNTDTNFSLSLSGQYDVAESLISRFGHNLIDSNNSGPDADFTNNKSYLEFDWAPGRERNMHIVVRGDINRYMHEDGTLNYKEHQAVVKCVLNF
ncbi:MAG: hypothetical protein GXY05_12125 [Clostridiales bacterium]|nr:hypothetical protein [Clostridiales bacterium]